MGTFLCTSAGERLVLQSSLFGCSYIVSSDRCASIEHFQYFSNFEFVVHLFCIRIKYNFTSKKKSRNSNIILNKNHDKQDDELQKVVESTSRSNSTLGAFLRIRDRGQENQRQSPFDGVDLFSLRYKRRNPGRCGKARAVHVRL